MLDEPTEYRSTVQYICKMWTIEIQAAQKLLAHACTTTWDE